MSYDGFHTDSWWGSDIEALEDGLRASAEAAERETVPPLVLPAHAALAPGCGHRVVNCACASGRPTMPENSFGPEDEIGGSG